MSSGKEEHKQKQKQQPRKIFAEINQKRSEYGKLKGNKTVSLPKQRTEEDQKQHKHKLDKPLKQAKIKKITAQERSVPLENVIQPKTVYLVEPSLVERRKLNIKTKLINLYEPAFNRIEEEEINGRAEIYAATTPPESDYFILPENVDDQTSFPHPTPKGKNPNIRCCGASVKDRPKRKRRSYNNIECFVTHTRKDDVFGSKHYLPAGTKLIKPPKKLVELVAQAVDRSPDGMLQVQQIYSVLQNKFPYFRYMDKLAISSWRSSIRHALYQKWFRKIRFSTESISAKGCFWAINRSLNPDEWIVPYDPDLATTWKKPAMTTSTPFLDMLQEPRLEEEEHLKDVIQIAKEYGISFSECVAEAKGEFQALEKLNIPSPVRDPDPVLVACVPDYSLQTPKARKRHFEVDEGFEELPFKMTPMKISPTGSSDLSETTSDDSLLAWTSLSFEDLPNLFSPTYSMHPYGMPVFPEQHSQNYM